MDKFQTFLLMAKEIESEIEETLNSQSSNNPVLHVEQPHNDLAFCMSKEIENYLLSLNDTDKMNSEIDEIYQRTLKSLKD